MADNLQLTVSKEKYQSTINQLQSKVTSLEQCKSDLESQRTRLQRAFTGAVGSVLLNTINKNIDNTQTAIQKVNDQIKNIENYLTTMTSATSKAQTLADESKSKADAVFGS